MIIQEQTVDLETPSGPMRTYLYRPVAGGRFPGLMLFSEIFQRTAPIGRTAAMLAGHGYVVAVPEVFHELEPAGCVLPYDQAGADAGNRHKLEKPVASHDDDVRALCAALRAHPACTGKLGAMGMCLGGHLSFRAALAPGVRAAACLYATDLHKASLGPGGDDSLARAGELGAELLMIWGRQDPHVPPEGRAKIYERLSASGARFSWHEFNAAHAFLRDEGPRYDPELTLICYRLVLDLFARRLGEGEA
jgi:carboxymethylenebutenolidase